MAVPKGLRGPSQPTWRDYLGGVHRNHAKLCQSYAAAVRAGGTEEAERAVRPNVLSLRALEFGNRPPAAQVDFQKLLVPSALLHAHSETDALSTTSSNLLPLLRCIGVPNAMRLLSALLCERRVVLTSRSPARLSGCSRGAVSMLAQGVLAWQHVYVPVLPPGMMAYLGAPMPYLVGVLASYVPVLRRLPGLGEVVVFDLDSNEVDVLNCPQPHLLVPDLLRPSSRPADDYGQRYVSLTEVLGQDLAECVRADKGSGYGPSNVEDKLSAAVSQAGYKASSLLKGAVKSLKKQNSAAKARSRDHSGGSSGMGSSSEHGDQQENWDGSSRQGSGSGAGGGPPVPPETNYSFGEGYENVASEEEARIAFTSFFLSFLGDMRWYLTQPGPGQGPTLDRNKFIEERRRAGDEQGTAMYPVLALFVQTQIFEQFALARVAELQARRPVAKDDALFHLASNHLRVLRMSFSTVNVRRAVQEVSQTANPSQYLTDWNIAIRRKTMALTSNSRNEAAVRGTTTAIVEDCRECSAMLIDVMAVIWERVRDSRGMQWKHALFALQLLRELIIHGPITAVTEAQDGLDKLRSLKSYDFAMRAPNSDQVRRTATHVYGLVVDQSKLFNLRRTAAVARQRRQMPKERSPHKDSRIRIIMRGPNVHDLVRPSFFQRNPKVAPAPPLPSPGRQAPRQQVPGPPPDLLGMSPSPAQAPQPSPARSSAPNSGSGVNELADLLGAASVAPAAPAPLPRAPAQTPQQYQATMVQIPGHPYQQGQPQHPPQQHQPTQQHSATPQQGMQFNGQVVPRAPAPGINPTYQMQPNVQGQQYQQQPAAPSSQQMHAQPQMHAHQPPAQQQQQQAAYRQQQQPTMQQQQQQQQFAHGQYSAAQPPGGVHQMQPQQQQPQPNKPAMQFDPFA